MWPVKIYVEDEYVRAARGGMAVMVIECDQEIPEEGLVWLRRQEGIRKVTYLSLR